MTKFQKSISFIVESYGCTIMCSEKGKSERLFFNGQGIYYNIYADKFSDNTTFINKFVFCNGLV